MNARVCVRLNVCVCLNGCVYMYVCVCVCIATGESCISMILYYIVLVNESQS